MLKFEPDMKYLSVNHNMQILFQGVIYLFGNTGKDPGNVYLNCWTCYCSNQVETPLTAEFPAPEGGPEASASGGLETTYSF